VSSDPDLPLLQVLQAGRDSALEELIARHREPLFRFAYRYLRDETAAADVVQETFVRVYFKAPRFEPRSSVKTWVYTIALNLCRDFARGRSRRAGDLRLDAETEQGGPANAPADQAPLPSEQSERSDRFAVLRQAIDLLPHKLKAALVLFSLEERSQNEVAELLETTPKTVELRVYHAKKKLRELLGGKFSNIE
jgi:RNA polymerase sigma factor (sigma-70 family)